MGIRDVIEVAADNVKELVKNPGKQTTRALGVLVDGVKNDGMVGTAAKLMSADGVKRRVDSAVDDTVNDPTHVHYGGNPGSSVRRDNE